MFLTGELVKLLVLFDNIVLRSLVGCTKVLPGKVRHLQKGSSNSNSCVS